MKYCAAIHILHFTTNTQFYTVDEYTASPEEAREQFSKLAEVISSMEKDNHSIVLETNDGYVMFTRKFLSDCIFRLKLIEVEEYPDDYDR